MSLMDEHFFATLELLRLHNYFAVAGIAVVLADYIHTFQSEMSLIWPTRMSIPKLIYFAVRYGNFVLGLFECIYKFTPLLSPKGCKRMFHAITVFEVILSSLGEAIIYLRVAAFSARSFNVVCLLATLFTVLNVSAISIVVKWILSVKAVESLSSIPGFGCVVSQGDTIYPILLHAELLLSVTLLAGMMVAIGLRKYRLAGLSYRDHGGGLLAQFYHTGIGYFLALIVLNAVNILVNLLGPEDSRYLLTRFQIYVHGVIVVRVILHLREYSERARTISIGSLDVANGGDESAMAGFSVRRQDINQRDHENL